MGPQPWELHWGYWSSWVLPAAPICPCQPLHCFPSDKAEICFLIGFYCRQSRELLNLHPVIQPPVSPPLVIYGYLLRVFPRRAACAASSGEQHFFPCSYTARITNLFPAWEEKKKKNPAFFFFFFFLPSFGNCNTQKWFYFKPRFSPHLPRLPAP